ncbi:MAG: protoheme IX farnesyltransferase [Deltaproteobacteria bacterium]|nr:MAG: protoheme IX farnesyltransferase [Deltaproteobacteria bacterium]
MERVATPLRPSLADWISLTKPGITRMVVISTIGGMWLAPETMQLSTALLTVLGMVLVVSGANALNCYLEREVDRHMDRTADRPLPAGRMDPEGALYFGLALSAVSIPLLTLGAGPLAALLAGAALVLYVLVYTPLKRLSPLSTVVGAFPGALPTLVGYAAVSETLRPPAFVLFAILFLWQMPHFYAIGLFRREEYAAAGLQIASVVHGEVATRVQMARYATALLPVSLLLVPMGAAGVVYALGAAVLGIAFLLLCIVGVLRGGGRRWARLVFHGSLVYLLGLIAVLVADAIVRA